MDSEYYHSNVKELEKEIARINKSYDKYNRNNAFEPLCKALWSNTELFNNYFSMTSFSYHHGDIAARLFALYGQSVYFRVKSIMPKFCGNVLSSWDDLMVFQVKRIEYNATHPWPDGSYCPVFSQFIGAIHVVCDDDLLLELMTYISRSSLFQHFIPNLFFGDFPIDYSFIMRRSETMNMNLNCMNRYLHLAKVLSVFDHTDAFKAWGQFYYIFEDVYLKQPYIHKGFTADFYNMFFYELHRKNEIQRNTSREQFDVTEEKTNISLEDYKESVEAVSAEFDAIIYQGRGSIDSTIYLYGWDVLHHLFELNADSDEASKNRVLGQSLIYDKLPVEDQKKADEAIRQFKLAHLTSPPSAKTNSALKQTKIMTDIMNLSFENSALGLNSWKNELIKISEQKKKITKKQITECLDRPLWNLVLRERTESHITYVPFREAPFIKVKFANILLTILNDKWFTEFYFSHCSQHGCASDMASILLIRSQEDDYRWICSLIANNTSFSLSYENFVVNVNNKLFYFISSYLNKSVRTDATNDDQVNTRTLSDFTFDNELIDFTMNPDLFETLCGLLRNYYHNSPASAMRLIHNLVSKAQSNDRSKAQWFLDSYDNLLEAIDFTVDRFSEELLLDTLFYYTTFEYSKDIKIIEDMLHLLYEHDRQQDIHFRIKSLDSNVYISEKEKRRLVNRFS